MRLIIVVMSSTLILLPDVEFDVVVDPAGGIGGEGGVKRVEGIPCKTDCAALWISMRS